MEVSKNHYNAEQYKFVNNNKNLGLNIKKTETVSIDIIDICPKFIDECKELDINSVFSLPSQDRFEQFKNSVIKNHGKKYLPIQIAQLVLNSLYFERNYISSLIEVLKVSQAYKLLLEDALKNKTPITTSYSNSIYSPTLSSEDLSSSDPQKAAFIIKYFYVVESEIRPKLNLSSSVIEELKDYWEHKNPVIALQAKNLYYQLSAKILETKFYHTEYPHFTLGNTHYGLHFLEYPQIHNISMPDFTPLLLKNIIPISTLAFAGYSSIMHSLKHLEKTEKNKASFLERLYTLNQINIYNPIKNLIDFYLNNQSKQKDLYNVVYSIWLENKKNMLKKKVDTKNFSHLEYWSMPFINKTDLHSPLPQSIGEALTFKDDLSTTFTLTQGQKKTSSQEFKIDSIIKIEKHSITPNKTKPKKPKKNRNRTKKTENPNTTTTSTTKPSTPTITLRVRSQEEEEVHQLLLKSPFKKVFRISRWQNLTDSIPKNDEFPEYVDLDEKKQVLQIKRHGFCSEVDRLLHDKRFTIKTEKGSHLLAHVQFDEQDKQTAEFSVISYAFNPEKKMYHRYIHSFGTQIFHNDLSKNIEKITISDSPMETKHQETKQKPTEGTEIQFDRRSRIFTFKDTIRGMTITVFPAPEPEDK